MDLIKHLILKIVRHNYFTNFSNRKSSKTKKKKINPANARFI